MIEDHGASTASTGLSSPTEPQGVSALRASIPSAVDCRTCAGSGWVCEEHRDIAWDSGGGCCGAAGAPCGSCSLEMASAGFVFRRDRAIASWIMELEPNYSGWNDHDQHFDSGWNGALHWVAMQINSGRHWRAASAIEARSDATGTGAAEGESAGPKDDTQPGDQP